MKLEIFTWSEFFYFILS